MMTKKRVVTSFEKLSPDVFKAIVAKYPDGWTNHVMRINKPNGEFFHAITIDTEDTSYLIKVNVKVDSKSDLEKEEEDTRDTGGGFEADRSDADATEVADPSSGDDDDF